MKTIAIEDIKFRVFIDANILIDCFCTPENDVIEFIRSASDNDLINLTTSDYALWEQNEFIRKQAWLKFLIDSGRSHKEALTNKLKLTTELKQQIELSITNAQIARERLNIYNYNLMDNASPERDFFSMVQLLTIHSTISSQDLFILLSAYVTNSSAIITRDGNFNASMSEIISLEEALGKSLFPASLKSIKFINDFTKQPVLYYKTWFENKIEPLKIGTCIGYYDKANVLAIECLDGEELNVNDYLLLTKFDDTSNFHKIVFRLTPDNLHDYDQEVAVSKCSKATIKLPVDIKTEKWMQGGNIFKISYD